MGGILVFRNHFLAAAGVSRQGDAGQRGVPGKHARRGQRGDQSDKSAGVTSGIGDPLGLGDFFSLSAQFGKAVHPSVRRAVGGGGVDHGGGGILNERNGFPCRIIGQAQKSDVRRVQHLPSGPGILAERLGQSQKRYIGAIGQPIRDPKTGGAGAAVNKYLCHSGPPLGGVGPENKKIHPWMWIIIHKTLYNVNNLCKIIHPRAGFWRMLWGMAKRTGA